MSIHSASSEDDLANLKILLVEDNIINQKVTLKQLDNLGYRADLVENGQAAVEAIAQTSYDIVLMDCQMPILDGYNATRKIRQMESMAGQGSQRVVIIAVTANAQIQDRERAIAVGMDDYLQRPVGRDMLATTLKKWGEKIIKARSAVLPDAAQADPELPDCSTAVDKNSFSSQINWEHLHQVSDNNPEFELELLQIFTADSFNHLALLKEAIAALNFREAERQAHYIKGASANVGAMQIQAAADQLEQQARQNQLENASLLLSALETSLKQVHNLIN